jgi:hypothetical protein
LQKRKSTSTSKCTPTMSTVPRDPRQEGQGQEVFDRRRARHRSRELPLPPPCLPSSSSSSSNCQGRARSAPTPPLTYQTIHIPTVCMPSCPPSPTLRSQRTPLPKHFLDSNVPARMTYIPDDTLCLHLSHNPRYGTFVRLLWYRSLIPLFQNDQMFQYSTCPDRACSPPGTTRCHRSRYLRRTLPSCRTASFPLLQLSTPRLPHHQRTARSLLSFVRYPHTQSLDGALGFVSQVDGNCYDQSFMEYSSYSWGNTEWQNVNEIGSSDEYALSSIPAAEPGIPDYGQLSVPERSGDFCPPPLTATATINRSWNTLRTAGITLANHRTLL